MAPALVFSAIPIDAYRTSLDLGALQVCHLRTCSAPRFASLSVIPVVVIKLHTLDGKGCTDSAFSGGEAGAFLKIEYV